MLISSAANLKASRGYGDHNVPFAMPAARSGLNSQRCSSLWQGYISATAGKMFDAETGYKDECIHDCVVMGNLTLVIFVLFPTMC